MSFFQTMFRKSSPLVLLLATGLWLLAGAQAQAKQTTGSTKKQTGSAAKKEGSAAKKEGSDTKQTGSQSKSTKTKLLAINVGRDEFKFTVPENWKAKKIKPFLRNIIKHDLVLSKAEGDPQDGRLTMSLSSGGTQANIDRWQSQFQLPVGAAAADAVKITPKKMQGYDVSIVQINGTFVDSMGGGPFAGGKKVKRPGYVLHAAIFAKEGATARTPKGFFKFVGPQATAKKHAAAVEKILNSVQIGPAKITEE